VTEPTASWDNVLRALVDIAFDARDTSIVDGQVIPTPAFAEVLEDIRVAWTRWPMIEYHITKRAADRDLERRRAERESVLQVLRDSNDLVSPARGAACAA
jgi:hypothetical protein